MKYVALILALLLAAPSVAAAQGIAPARLVVQQNGQALVTESRVLTLPKGIGVVLLPDLPATIEAQTLQVRSKTSPKDLDVLDLTLDEDQLTPSALLRRNVGQKVRLILPDGTTRDGRVQKEAVVLSTEEAPLFLVDGQIYSGPVEAIIYPELPAGMASRPRLSLNLDNGGPARQTLELSYIAREISWRMDYVLTLNQAGDSGLLSGWVTLTNKSGKGFDLASIELLAGEPKTVRPMPMRAFMSDSLGSAKSIENFTTESSELFEYHLYSLKRPVPLANQQSRQVPLFKSATIPVTRSLVGRAGAMPTGHETEPTRQNLVAVLSFRNTQALGLGLPLPKGILRAFQEQNGVRRQLGESQVERAAVGATVEARLGQSFDVSVERTPTQYEKIGKNSYRVAWELRIRNGKNKVQRIELQEQIPGKWKIESASHKGNKAAAGVLAFEVDVPPTGDGAPLLLKYSYTTDL